MSGNIQQLAFLSGFGNPEDINCHYVICNGLGAGDGQIQPTERWQKQEPVNRDWLIHEPQAGNGRQTIFICLIADVKDARPTRMQIKVTEELLKGLCRKFDIKPESIHYPGDWQ
jgi:hypothetical protein